ncbi:MAG: CoA-binding protein, partial [Deltaproteobacteria bacterium]|nr:CoA-binding protein [Deltaproteobacteria bacterium]
MQADRFRRVLRAPRTIAIVGAKDKPGEAVDSVGRYLIRAGFTIVPIHPARREVWGLKAYPHLGDVPAPIDIVNVFRAPEYCAGHAREAAALTPRPGTFWMQLGITNAEASRIAAEAGMDVADDCCIMIE